MFLSRRGFCPGGVSVPEGFLSRRGFCPGGVSVPEGFLSRRGFCPGGVSVPEGFLSRRGFCPGGVSVPEGFPLRWASVASSRLRMLVGELLPWGLGLLPFGCGDRSAGPGWAEMKSPRRTRGLVGLPVGDGSWFQ